MSLKVHVDYQKKAKSSKNEKIPTCGVAFVMRKTTKTLISGRKIKAA
jgi:hypothetical protein